MAGAEPPRLLVDACVLYPHIARALVAEGALAGLLTPLWSARILEEWRIAATRNGAEDEASGAILRLGRAFPGAEVTGYADLEVQLTLPDAADTHVLAAAIIGAATAILTFNIGDFPQRRLAPHGIGLLHPDAFFREALSTDPARTAPVVARALAGTLGPEAREISEPKAARKALRRAQLPRLGKLWETVLPTL